jgi:hypothetical protein
MRRPKEGELWTFHGTGNDGNKYTKMYKILGFNVDKGKECVVLDNLTDGHTLSGKYPVSNFLKKDASGGWKWTLKGVGFNTIDEPVNKGEDVIEI